MRLVELSTEFAIEIPEGTRKKRYLRVCKLKPNRSLANLRG